MAAMPRCDFGPLSRRSGVTWKVTFSLRFDDQRALTIPFPPHEGHIAARGGIITLFFLSGDVSGRVGTDREIDASQEVTIRCGETARRDTLKYRGRLTREGRNSTLKLEAQVTPCPGDACSVSVLHKLTRNPDSTQSGATTATPSLTPEH